jgi:hypothetical protein
MTKPARAFPIVITCSCGNTVLSVEISPAIKLNGLASHIRLNGTVLVKCGECRMWTEVIDGGTITGLAGRVNL